MTENSFNSKFDLKKFLYEILKYWYLFLISLIVFFILTVFYIKFTSKTFNITATLLIKTNENNNISSNENDILNVRDMITQEINLQNEIIFLQSTPLIKKVLQELNLGIAYYMQANGIPKEITSSLFDIYKESPFIVIVDEKHVQPINTLFYVHIVNNEEFGIAATNKKAAIFDYITESYQSLETNFSLNGKFRFGDLIQNEYTSFRILLNSNFDNKKFAGRDLFFEFNDLNKLAGIYQKSLKIETSILESTVAEFTFVGNNIDKSIDFINGLINRYTQQNLDEKNYLAMNTVAYIDRQLSNISDSLILTERKLQNYRFTSNVMNIDEKANRIYTQLLSLENQRDETQKRFKYLQQVDRYFDAYKDSSQMVIPSSFGLEDPLLDNLIQQLTTLNAEKDQIIRNEQLKNPRLITLDISIENLKNVISENLKFNLSATANSLQDIEGRISDLNYEFSRLPQTQRELLGFERKFHLTETVYTSLLEKRIQAQIAEASTLPDCEIIEPARFVAVAWPKTILCFGIGLFLGLLIPLCYLLIRDFFTDVIKTKDDIKKYFDLQQIGYIPHHNKISTIIIEKYPLEPASEAFRTVRSNLDYFLLGKKHKIILITSSIPQEGKSFISFNLATSFALAQNRTLLIGFDLRKIDNIYKEFHIQELVGISNYLIGKATLEDITIQTHIQNLDLIIPGKIPPNPVEIITSDKTRDLLEQVRQNYDYIIIDTPPFGLVTDAFILMKYADLSLYVARLNRVTTKALKSSFEEIIDKNLKNIYLLINDVKPGVAEYSKYSKYPYNKDKNLKNNNKNKWLSKKKLNKVIS